MLSAVSSKESCERSGTIAEDFSSFYICPPDFRAFLYIVLVTRKSEEGGNEAGGVKPVTAGSCRIIVRVLYCRPGERLDIRRAWHASNFA